MGKQPVYIISFSNIVSGCPCSSNAYTNAPNIKEQAHGLFVLCHDSDTTQGDLMIEINKVCSILIFWIGDMIQICSRGGCWLLAKD